MLLADECTGMLSAKSLITAKWHIGPLLASSPSALCLRLLCADGCAILIMQRILACLGYKYLPISMTFIILEEEKQLLQGKMYLTIAENNLFSSIKLTA